MSRFIQNGDISLLPKYIKGYGFYFAGNLVGVLAISEGGIVLHHFEEKYLDENFKYKGDFEKLILLPKALGVLFFLLLNCQYMLQLHALKRPYRNLQLLLAVKFL